METEYIKSPSGGFKIEMDFDEDLYAIYSSSDVELLSTDSYLEFTQELIELIKAK